MATALVARRQAAKVEFRVRLADVGRAGDTLLPRDVAREQAERREREWAQWEFRCQVEGWLREQGEGWPTVTEDHWGKRHYSTPRLAPLDGTWWSWTRAYVLRRAGPQGRVWWTARLLYGPRGTRRERA